MDLLVEQSLSAEFGKVVKEARTDSTRESSIDESIRILSSVSPGFSIQQMSHELLKILASCVQLPTTSQGSVAKLLDLLRERFAHSFRPSPKDVLDIFRAAVQSNASWIYSHLLLLINVALQNMQGNPKSVFLYICDDLFDILSPMDEDTFSSHLQIVRSIVSVMFRSNSNMACLSAYMQSGSGSGSQTGSSSKKRKSTTNESYVSHLFDGVGANSQLAKLVLGEYVSRQRDLNASDAPDCFLFFSRLLSSLTLEGQIELWRFMSLDLRMYRLRDEVSDIHKSALSEFYDRVALDPGHQWEGLETVLLVDPVNFTDKVIEKSIALLSDSIQTGKKTCLNALFHTFAIKGSLADLVRRILEASTNKNLLESINVETEVFISGRPVADQVSAIDAMDCLEVLLRTILGSESVSQKECAQNMLEPLMKSSVQRIPEHMCVRATEVFVDALRNLVDVRYPELKKTERRTTSRLILGLVDSLRKVYISQRLPFDDSHEKMDVIETALNVIAQKDSKYRGAALIRLGQLCSVEVSAADLMGAVDIEKHMADFIDAQSVNCSCLWSTYRTDPAWDSLRAFLRNSLNQSNFKAFPEQLVPLEWFPKPSSVASNESVGSSAGEVDSLLEKSRALVAHFPRVAFTPVSLRKADFPTEILSVELAWANHTERLDTLLSNQSLEALYGMTILVEEGRRNKLSMPYDVVYSALSNRANVPLVAKARCLLALHGVSGLDQKESADMLLALSADLLSQDIRDRTCVDAAYFCLFQALITGSDRRRIRVPWWSTKMHAVMVAVRGLIGSCISGSDNVAQTEAAQYVVRIWKTIVDSVSSEKLYRISKAVALLAGEYIRLSSKITNSECAAVLDRGCCVLLNKLTESERRFLHAILGKNDRESLKRLVEMLERSFKYKGKV